MAVSAIGNEYGTTHFQIWRQTATGLPTGQLDPASLVNNTTSHAYKTQGITAATPPERGYDPTTFRDGNMVRGIVDTGLTSIGKGTITLNLIDANLMTLLGGGNKDTTSLVNAVIAATNTGKIIPFTIGLMFAYIQHSRADDTWGQSQWVNRIYPKCTARLLPSALSQESGVNPMTWTMEFTPQRSNKFPAGNAFGANQNWVNYQEMEYFVWSEYPYALTAYVQDGAATDYTLGYLPVSSTVTSGNTTNWFTQNGTVTAPTSCSTTTGVVVKAAAGTAAQIAAAFYQTDFVAVP